MAGIRQKSSVAVFPFPWSIQKQNSWVKKVKTT